MKISKIGIGIMISVILWACSNDTNQPYNNIEEGRYVTLKLVREYSNVRTLAGENDTESTEDDESHIKDVLILLTDETGKVVHVRMPKLVQAASGGIYTQPFLVEEGTFNVYAIANPGDINCTQEYWKERNLEDDRVQVIDEEGVKSYLNSGNFLMFNECEGEKTRTVTVTVTQEHTVDNPAQGTAPIKLDRLAAKILSVGSEKVDIKGITQQLGDIVAVEIEGYVLLNGSKTAYLQQHWVKEQLENGDNVYILETPAMKYEEWGESSFDDYYCSFGSYAEVQKEGDTYVCIEDLLVEQKLNTDALFCVENHTDYYRGNTTGLIYRWKVVNENSDRLAGENCFYSYNSEYFSTLKDLQSKYPMVFGNDGYDTAVNMLENDLGQFRAKYQIRVYQGGNMYYTYYIKDKNHIDKNGNNYYAVMRNTVYHLNIVKLMKIGDDIPGGWEPHPEWLVDYNETYMQIDIKVNPWLLSNSEIELK